MRHHLSFVLLISVLQLPAMAGDHWQQTAGPFGGLVSYTAVKGENTIFAVLSSGLYRSTDLGSSWAVMNTGLFGSFGVYSGVVVDSGGVVLAIGSTQGVVSSGDSGETWEQIDAGISDARSYDEIMVAPNGTILMLVTDGLGESLYQSADHGVTWTAMSRTGLPSDVNISTVACGASWIYAITSKQTGGATSLYRWSNSGNTWAQCGTGVIPQNDTISEVNAVDGGFVFVASEQIVNNEYQYRNFRSTDEGATWTEISNAVPPYTAIASIIRFASLGLIATVYKQENEQICGCRVFVFVDLMHSTDNGVTWSSVGAIGREGVPIDKVRSTTSSAVFGMGQRGGLYRSTNNGTSWELTVTGLRSAVVHSVAVDSSNNVYAGTLESGLYRSKNGGATWDRCTNGIPGAGSFQILGVRYGEVLAADTARGVFRSIDFGDTWTSTNAGLADVRVTSIAGDVSGNVYVGTRTGVFRSTDDGISWAAAGVGIPNGLTVYALSINEHDMSYAGTTEGVFRSSDAGSTWSIASNGLVNLRLYSLAQTPGGTAFAGTFNGFFRSEDKGTTWTKSDSGMVEGDTYVTSINPQPDGSIIATAYVTAFGFPPVGVYRSTNNGHSWRRNDTGITIRPSVTWGVARAKNGAKYLATSHMGVMKEVSALDVAESNPLTPVQFGLTVYPNPAGDRATIRVEGSASTIASISLVDCLGRELTKLSPSQRSQIHEYSISTTQLPPGLYYVRSITPNGITQHPILILH